MAIALITLGNGPTVEAWVPGEVTDDNAFELAMRIFEVMHDVTEVSFEKG